MIPPHNHEIEQAVLGAVLLAPQSFADIGDVLTEDDFYRREHREIFAALSRLDSAGNPIDLLTLADALRKSGELEGVGGMAYLGNLLRNTASAANARSYAQRVRDLALERQALKAVTEAHGLLETPADTAEKIGKIQQLFTDIGGRANEGPRSVGAAIPAWLDRLDTLAQRDEEIIGLPTGYVDLDRMTSGLQGGDLVIVAGRPSMGKTTLGMNIAEHCALKLQQPALVFSMEMPTEQLISRATSSLGRIQFDLVRNPAKLREEDWPRLNKVVGELAKAPLYIDDTPALSPMEMRARARRIKQRHGLGLIVVDYLQLMQIPGHKENRTAEISEISRSLKAMAKELGVPVIALSQLNRSLEQRPNKRPVMSDLRESGAIEQDADVICFVYRDEVYNPAEGDDDRAGVAEIIIGKQRNGPLGTVHLTFLGQFCRFDSCEHQARKRYDQIMQARNNPERKSARKAEAFDDL